MMKKTDMIIAGVALAAALVCYVGYYSHTHVSKAKAEKVDEKVVVSIGGQVVGKYDLHKDDEFIIDGENGISNHLVIKDGIADVVSANCPDKLCVHQSSISQNGEIIVCLPAEVIVEIETKEPEEYEAIAN